MKRSVERRVMFCIDGRGGFYTERKMRSTVKVVRQLVSRNQVIPICVFTAVFPSRKGKDSDSGKLVVLDDFLRSYICGVCSELSVRTHEILLCMRRFPQSSEARFNTY